MEVVTYHQILLRFPLPSLLLSWSSVHSYSNAPFGCLALVAAQQLGSVQETFFARLHNHTGFLSRSNALYILLLLDTTNSSTKSNSFQALHFLCEIFLKYVHSKNHMWNLCSASSPVSQYPALQCKCSNCSPPALMLKTSLQYVLCLVAKQWTG